MEVDSILYEEIKFLRKDISRLRDELSSFKLKVYAVAMLIGTGAGGLGAKLFAILK